MLFGIAALLAVTSAGCQGTGTSAGAQGAKPFRGVTAEGRYEEIQPFQRILGANELGLRVHSGLASGSLSDQQIKQLSTFLSDLLDESGAYDLVLDLTYSNDTSSVELLLDLVITDFHRATQQELAAGKPSRLTGNLTIKQTDGLQRTVGVATIWATGVRLDLVGNTEAPDTVIEFADVIRDIMQ